MDFVRSSYQGEKKNPGTGREISMRIEKVREVLNDPLAVELLSASIPARLAYTGTDGFPRVIPIGFWWNGAEVVVCTAPTAPKVKALLANPKVALTIDTESAPQRALFIRGTAASDLVDGVPPEYFAAARKGSTDEAGAQQFEEQVRAVHRQMVRFKITPEWAKVFDFGTGRLPGFLQELVDKAQPTA